MSRTILTKVAGFTPIIDIVMKDTSLITSVVFGGMWRYCQMKNGVCQATLDKIAERVGLSRQAIIEHIKTLEDAGYIEDMTPNLRNRPHTYRDTGKAGLYMGVSTVNDVYSENDQDIPTVNDVDSAVNDVDSHSTPRVLEDSIKRGVKTQECALSKENMEKANETVDAILGFAKTGQERESMGLSWPGREKFDEPIRDLLDTFVKVSGIKPTKGQLMDWLGSGQDWLEIGAHPQDISKAYEESRPNEKGFGGFACYRPGSLTGAIQKVVGERRKGSQISRPSLGQALAEIERMQR